MARNRILKSRVLVRSYFLKVRSCRFRGILFREELFGLVFLFFWEVVVFVVEEFISDKGGVVGLWVVFVFRVGVDIFLEGIVFRGFVRVVGV